MSASSTVASIPIGPRLQAVLSLAWRARKPVLLKGESGIGKSEIFAATAADLGIQCKVLDLSLLEPPDLTGLPYVEHGLTRYAPPASLPRDGEGILVLEELNRSERYVRQPVLQLLSARRLNDYQLPPGWSVAASINPSDGAYQVDALDPALEDRFMVYDTCPDRDQWLAWASATGVQRAVVEVVRRHEKAFEEVSPRTWKSVSDMVSILGRDSEAATPFVRDALRGYLPEVWVEALIAAREFWDEDWDVDARTLLHGHAKDPAALARLVGLGQRGRTDVLERIAYDALGVVSGHDLADLAKQGEFDLGSFEQLLAELPGGYADQLQEAFGSNPEAGPLLEVGLDQVLYGFVEFGAAKLVSDWLSRRATRHRAWALATGVITALDRRPDIEPVRKSRSARIGLGALLARLSAPQDRRFRDALVQLRIDPILPPAMRHCA